jgi:hypothetical protein
MGFMDKAKKMAEQAQSKLDEVQKQFNENQGSAPTPPAGPITDYDAHGRPIPQEQEAVTPPSAPPAPAAPPQPPAPEAAAPAPPAPPAPAPEAERSDEYAPPKLTSGDPLEG